MLRPFQHLLIALALLALAFAQVFGMGRGFLCDCGGVERVTFADHCHGPHSAACHQHEDEAPFPCQGTEDHHDGEEGSEGGTHEHQALIESLLASISSKIEFSAIAPALVALVMPEWQSPSLTGPASLTSSASLSAHPPPVAHRPWPQMLTHAVALRI
ncbi:hypothetical protein [Prosthecobacter sp.]|uniref:hypothetical protein n=1 Tax=Prosthecobacter sp. TaxID=1965333 RepID=UPI003784C771